MSALQEVEDLRKRVDAAKAKADRAAGALEKDLGRLKEDFECDSLEEAEKLLKKITKKEVGAKALYEEKKEAFEEEWGEHL